MIANEVGEGDKIEVYYDKRIEGLNIRPKVVIDESVNQNKENTLQDTQEYE